MPRSGLVSPNIAPTISVDRAAPGLLGLMLVLGLILPAAIARADKLPSGNISEIRIEGADTVSEQKILGKLKSHVGRPFDKRMVEEDQQTLQKSNWFSNVRSSADTDRKGGVILYFTVVEMPILRHVEFRG